MDARLPGLLASGGPDAVIAEAAESRGGHAGGVYLERLVRSRPLDPDRVARLLGVATDVVTVDAAMADLLAAVRARHDVGAPPVAAAYRRAARTLEARAARRRPSRAGGRSGAPWNSSSTANPDGPSAGRAPGTVRGAGRAGRRPGRA